MARTIGIIGSWYVLDRKPRQTAYKPGSVPPMRMRVGRDGHSSRTPVTERLMRPTRAATRRSAWHPRHTGMPAAPTWSCSRWGFPCRRRCRRRGALLPHRFTLAARPVLPGQAGGVLSVALSLGSPPPGVTRHRTSVEPGLSSLRATRGAAIRPSGATAFGSPQRACQSLKTKL